MLDKIEVDLKGACAMGHLRGSQSSCRDIKGDVPGMIEPRRLRQPDFADDLRPHLQRLARVFPGIEIKLRPEIARRHGNDKRQAYSSEESRNGRRTRWNTLVASLFAR